MPKLKSNNLRASAKGQDCTFNIAHVCNYNPETTVLCHINTDGGKIGGKSEDISAAFGCSNCHNWLDSNLGSELDGLYYSMRAMIRTQNKWIEMGLLCIK